MPQPPQYPVYESPDSEHERIASTPAQEVQLKHAGWRLKREPRKRKTPGGDLSRWQKPETT